MTAAPDRDLVDAAHPDREALDALVAELRGLPAEAWDLSPAPAVDAPPEIAAPREGARPARRRWWPRLAGAGALAGAVAVLAVVLVAGVGGGGVQDADPRALRAIESGSSAAGTVRGADGRVRVELRGLAPIRSGARYEAWSLADPDRPRSLGVVRPDAAGAAVVEGDVAGPVGTVAVTREPAEDDDPGPSGDFVLRGDAA